MLHHIVCTIQGIPRSTQLAKRPVPDEFQVRPPLLQPLHGDVLPGWVEVHPRDLRSAAHDEISPIFVGDRRKAFRTELFAHAPIAIPQTEKRKRLLEAQGEKANHLREVFLFFQGVPSHLKPQLATKQGKKRDAMVWPTVTGQQEPHAIGFKVDWDQRRSWSLLPPRCPPVATAEMHRDHLLENIQDGCQLLKERCHGGLFHRAKPLSRTCSKGTSGAFEGNFGTSKRRSSSFESKSS